MNSVRRIALPHLSNLRDLGGYEAESGITKWGRLFRCDSPEELTTEEWKRLRDLEIRSLIDLRSTFESKEAPARPPEGITLRLCHFLPEDPRITDPNEAAMKFKESLSFDYRVMMENSLSETANILKAILLGLREGGVCFFCTAGKDRTGMVAAAILYLSGVRKEEIIADYVLTGIYNRKRMEERWRALPEEIRASYTREKMKRALASRPETMAELLTWMREKDFSGMMAKRGFDGDAVRELRRLIFTENGQG